jgi:DNA-binding NtrC family response regulator
MSVHPAAPRRVLMIDDDPDFCFALRCLIELIPGFSVDVAHTAAEARKALRASWYDAALVDLQLPDADGLRLIEELAISSPGVSLVCLTGRNDAAAAVRALRAGACEYLTKPVSREQLVRSLEQAVARSSLWREMTAEQVGGSVLLPIGEAPLWRQALGLVRAAAQANRTTVLVTGEPGVGKEIVASLVHRLSRRTAGPFVTVNAACLSPNLLESELFGHEAGAFTGAVKQRRGLFELADGGTLFLDEIGELSLDLQARRLRVLEGHSFRRVGGEKNLSFDVRLVCATNRRLRESVQRGLFRADLYERLRVFEVPLPPLRDRPGDAVRLAHHFLVRLAPELGSSAVTISPEAVAAIQAHRWPGNVRELRNVIERALLLAEEASIELRHLPTEVQGVPAAPSIPPPAPSVPPSSPSSPWAAGGPGAASSPASLAAPARSVSGRPLTLEEVIRAHTIAVYESTGQNVTHTAEQLGVSRLALRKRLQSYGLREPRG